MSPYIRHGTGVAGALAIILGFFLPWYNAPDSSSYGSCFKRSSLLDISNSAA